MASLDLRSINLGTFNILTFETKKQAKTHKLPHLCYIKEAANRFWLFYVIVRKSQDGNFAVLTKSGDFLTVEERYWVGGDKTYVTN